MNSRDEKFIRDEPGADDRLWIILSHVDVPLGKFAQRHVFADISGRKLFLNSGRNDWYLEGFPDIEGRLRGLADYLTSKIDQIGAKRVTIVGHSMGGYAAMELSRLISTPTDVVATSPEPQLGLEGSRSKQNGITARQAASAIGPVGSVAKELNGVVVFGAYDPIDAYFLARTDHPSMSGLSIWASPIHHGVTEFLTSRKCYTELLTFGIKADHWAAGLIVPPEALGTSDQFMNFYELNAKVNRREDVPIEQLSRYSDWPNAGYQNLRAAAFRRGGELEAAREACAIAFELAFYVPKYGLDLLRISRELGDANMIAFLADFLKHNFAGNPKVQAELQIVRRQMNNYPARTLEFLPDQRRYHLAFARRFTHDAAPLTADFGGERSGYFLAARREIAEPALRYHRLYELFAERGMRFEAHLLLRGAFEVLPSNAHLATQFVRSSVRMRRYDDLDVALDHFGTMPAHARKIAPMLKRVAINTTHLGLSRKVVKLLKKNDLYDDKFETDIVRHIKRFSVEFEEFIKNES